MTHAHVYTEGKCLASCRLLQSTVVTVCFPQTVTLMSCSCVAMYTQDAMETAAQSADPEIAEELLHYFVDNNERECFAASLYTCYDLIKPDVAMEVNLTHMVGHLYSIKL